MNNCPLCESENTTNYAKDKLREYRRCSVCDLIFVPPEFHVSPHEERERYLKHNNDEQDEGYRDFLTAIIDEITPRQPPGCFGLDFGSGPKPVLANMLRELGYEIETYDPYFDRRKSVLGIEYDFIVSTEVFEHLSSPGVEIERLAGLLDADSQLFVMTSPYEGTDNFVDWHYKNDKTHITFYTLETFEWISKRFGFEYELLNENCHLFTKVGWLV